jgi:hypothetical protein
VKLTPAQRRRLLQAAEALARAEERAEDARRRFAAIVRELGVSASARELGVGRQALQAKVARIERRETRR